MMVHPTTETRKLRADAIRNRERVLEAAKAVFTQGGAEASLEAVARHAGVGIGTLYRHFPTREALYEAVYRREVGQLVELARHLEGSTAPVEALRRWMRSFVEFVATKKGMAAALAVAAHGSSDLVAYSLDRLTGAVGELLHRAVAASEIRADIDPEDLLRTLVGLCYAHDRPGWQIKVLRLVDVFIDGLRRRPDKKHDRQACDADPAALMPAIHPTNPLRGTAPEARSARKTRRRPPTA
jgi:AcrR family transcriptional regulator